MTDPLRLLPEHFLSHAARGLSGLSRSAVDKHRAYLQSLGAELDPISENAVFHNHPERVSTASSAKGVGDFLGELISWIVHVRPANSAGCGCSTMQRELNQLKPEEVEERIESFVVRLAAKRKLLGQSLRADRSLARKIKGVIVPILPESTLCRRARQLITEAIQMTRDHIESFKSPQISQPPPPKGPPPPPFPFPGKPHLTLLFHCWPGHDWQRHVGKLAPVIDRFDRKILGIAYDRGGVTPAKVKRAFGSGWEYVVEKNVPNRGPQSGLREVVTYNKMLPMVESTDPNRVTVCLHGKGAQRHTSQPGSTWHWWTDAMYETIVYNLDDVLQRMAEGASVVGSFRRFGSHFRSKFGYHFSGTFYAFRNARVFGGDFPRYRQTWWGTESWPGDHVPVEASHCVIGDGCGDLSKIEEQPRREFEQWMRSKGRL